MYRFFTTIVLALAVSACGGGGSDVSVSGGSPSPDPIPTTGLDVFGVRMIYPSKAGGEAWFLTGDPRNDVRFDPQDPLGPNGDGSWKIRSNQVRMNVLTSTGYDRRAISTYDPDELDRRGYMQAPNDWKNVEMTGFVRVNAVSDREDNLSWYARGGLHTDSAPCEGTSYKGGLHYDGRARLEKESWHVSYDQTAYRTVTSSLLGRWVGFKTIMRNITYDGKPAVKLELWLNDNADKTTWMNIYDVVDHGQIGGALGFCGGSVPAAPITWGGPVATFRWDSASDVDFKWLSVREIAD